VSFSEEEENAQVLARVDRALPSASDWGIIDGMKRSGGKRVALHPADPGLQA